MQSPRIACLAWGSLVWNPETLADYIPGGWHSDGPWLPIEFARVSKNGRLTLVIDEGSPPIQVLWAEMAIEGLTDAVEVLRRREQCQASAIGVYPAPEHHRPGYRSIGRWALGKGLDIVIWTALAAKFGGQDSAPANAEAAVAYLRALPPEASQLAEEYVRRTPKQIRTPFRDVFERDLQWFPAE